MSIALHLSPLASRSLSGLRLRTLGGVWPRRTARRRPRGHRARRGRSSGTEAATAGSWRKPPQPSADGPPVLLAVTGVRSDDVLHLRDVPSADSKSLADIPPNARGLKKIGCMRVQLSMDRYMYMSKEERNNAQAPWCRVEYKGPTGLGLCALRQGRGRDQTR